MQDKDENKAQAGLARPGKRKIPWFLMLRLMGIVLFVVILLRIDIGEVWSQLKTVRWPVIFITLGMVMIQLFLKALRWHLLNKGTLNEKNPVRSFGEFFESYAIGIITPGRLGELLKAGYAKNVYGKISAGVRVLIERSIDFGIFLCIAGSAVTWSHIFEDGQAWGIVTILAGTVSILFAISLLRSERIYSVLEQLLSFLRISKHPLDRHIRSVGFSSWILLISVISNAVYFISCFFLAMNVSIDAGFLFISGGIAAAGLLNTIPITVMGLGTRELAFLYIFREYPPAVIMAFSALIFLCWQIGSGVLSILTGEFLMMKAGKKKSASRINPSP